MKKFDQPMVTISQEHFAHLKECEDILSIMGEKFDIWPQAFRLPAGTSFADLLPEDSLDFRFYTLRGRIDRVLGYESY